MIFQKLQNSSFNKHKEIIYFSGAFIPKNFFSHHLKGTFSLKKDDSNSLEQIAREYYDSYPETINYNRQENLTFDSRF